MKRKLIYLAITMALAGSVHAATTTLVMNDQTNKIEGLDTSEMFSLDNENSWIAYNNENQNNFPGNVTVTVATKDTDAVNSTTYNPELSYPNAGTVVRYDGYYWRSQWYVNPGEVPGQNAVWTKVKAISINKLGTFIFTPYTGQAATDFQKQQKEKVGKQRKVIGYFPEWGVYDAHNNFTPDKIDYSQFTHINYGFAVIKDGVVITHDTEQGPGLMQELDRRTAEAGVYNIVSVGGWNNSLEGEFEAATSTDAGIEKLANSIVAYALQWKFDGVDIDWEYPDTDAETTQFKKLLQSIRSKLDDEGIKTDKYYQLSVAVTTNHNNIKYISPKDVDPLVDNFNVMTYDIHGAFDPITGHNSPLYANSKDTDLKLNASSAMQEYNQAWGIAKNKLVMGLPYYSRAWGEVEPTEVVKGLPGLFAPGSATVHGEWDDEGQFTGTSPFYTLQKMAKDSNYTRYWDNESQVPYLYNAKTKEFYTYDDEQSITTKVNFIDQQGYGGAIIWDISGDTPEHTLGNIVKNLIEPDDVTPVPDGDVSGLKLDVSTNVVDLDTSVTTATPKIAFTLQKEDFQQQSYDIRVNDRSVASVNHGTVTSGYYSVTGNTVNITTNTLDLNANDIVTVLINKDGKYTENARLAVTNAMLNLTVLGGKALLDFDITYYNNAQAVEIIHLSKYAKGAVPEDCYLYINDKLVGTSIDQKVTNLKHSAYNKSTLLFTLPDVKLSVNDNLKLYNEDHQLIGQIIVPEGIYVH
ncbi:glycoside hydrolase family 18 protein [Enterobacter kobei]|uniref:glycoside hydrolase family 18 protein n=1 Tax=Enterobacter kobei TaxID=208224 RepID=UPI003A978A5B